MASKPGAGEKTMFYVWIVCNGTHYIVRRNLVNMNLSAITYFYALNVSTKWLRNIHEDFTLAKVEEVSENAKLFCALSVNMVHHVSSCLQRRCSFDLVRFTSCKIVLRIVSEYGSSCIYLFTETVQFWLGEIHIMRWSVKPVKWLLACVVMGTLLVWMSFYTKCGPQDDSLTRQDTNFYRCVHFSRKMT